MSRIGKKPIELPSGVEVTVDENNLVTVKGPKGTLELTVVKDMKVTVENNVLEVERPSETKAHRAIHGTTRALLNNLVVGVTEGFKKVAT